MPSISSDPGPNVASTHPSRGLAGLVLGILLFSGAWAVFAWQSRAKTQARIDEFESAFASRRFDQARATLESWRSASPNDSEVHFRIAKLAAAEDRLPDSIEALRKASELGHDGDDVEELRAVLLAKARQYKEAEPLLTKALERRKNSPDPLLAEALSQLYIETYRFGAASPILDAWIAKDPNNVKPYRWRIEVLTRISDDNPAIISALRDVLRRDPSYDGGRSLIAELLRDNHENAEAAEHYDIYLKRKPDDIAALVGAGRNALELGDERSATARFLAALKIDSNQALALRELASIDLREGRDEEAARKLESAIRADPYEPSGFHSYALALARLGREEEARTARERRDRLQREFTEMSDLQKKLVAAPNDPGLQASAAKWLIGHGKFEEGLVWAKKVLEVSPRHEELNRLLAEHYEKTGNLGLANYYRTRIGGPSPVRE